MPSYSFSPTFTPTFTSPVVTLFNSSGTFTKDPLSKYAIVEMIGAGGASIAVSSATGTGIGISGSGGNGGYIKAYLTSAQLGSTQAVTIGAGAAGTAGTSTTFGALLTANGGGIALAGNQNNPSPTVAIGDGGTPGSFTITTGVDLDSTNGAPGGVGLMFCMNSNVFNAVRGIAQPTQFNSNPNGTGVQIQSSFTGAGSQAAFTPVANSGAGCAGGLCSAGASIVSLAGASGCLRITEYY